MTKKITATPAVLSGPFQLDNPNTFWWVNSVGYTDDPGLIAYCQRAGYVMVDGSPDAAYTAAVAKLKVEAGRTGMHTNVAQDFIDPNRLNYFSAQS